MISCAKCGRENEDHYKYCLGCGASLSEAAAEAAAPAAEETCPTCGAETSPEQRFCGSCGTNLHRAVVDEPAKTAEPEPTQEPAPAAAEPAAAPAAAGDVVGALIMIQPDGNHGEIVDLASGKNVFGRSSDFEVFSRDEYLSPQHVSLTVSGDSVDVDDLDSLNGVFIQLKEVAELNHGDAVRIGQELLIFELLSQVEPVIPTQSDVVTHGSRRGRAWGRLSRVSGRGKASVAFLLSSGEHVMGRERGDILFPDDGYVSGTHARIYRDGDKTFIEDLRSSNGTFLRIRKQATIGSGSLILLGKQPFRLQLR